jgi:zinc transporter ZupT
MLILIAFAAFAATLIGGSFALRFRDQLHLILGFSAGAVVGVAFFDLLPEAMDVGSQHHSVATVALFVALGFLTYLVLDRLVFLHSHEEDDESHAHQRGAFGASTLSAHSFLDGIAIGIGFQTSAAVGLVITAAVLAHDFSDGINTVNLVLRNGGTWKQAFRWLLVDALAPVVGIAATMFYKVPEAALGLVLAVFAGCFLYLGAADLIPESHHRHPRIATTLITILGAGVIYLVVWAAAL